MPNYDAIIIGTGQAGPALARRLVAANWKVAIIERKLFGGTCVNTGCTPTKTLVASAYTAHVVRRAAEYGVRVEGAVTVDMKAVKARKDAVVAPSRNSVERSLKTLEGCTVYEGHGRFVTEKKVAVNGSELVADDASFSVDRERFDYCYPRWCTTLRCLGRIGFVQTQTLPLNLHFARGPKRTSSPRGQVTPSKTSA